MLSKGKNRSNSIIFTSFNQRQISELKEAFSLLDQNSDGLITGSDLNDLLISLGRSPNEAAALLVDIPPEAPGMNFTLFLARMGERLAEMDGEKELLAAFEVLDERQSGFISVQLLRELLRDLNEEDFELMLQGAELNDQGQLDYRHFVKLLTNYNTTSNSNSSSNE